MTRPFEVLRVNYILSSMHDVHEHNIIRCAKSIYSGKPLISYLKEKEKITSTPASSPCL